MYVLDTFSGIGCFSLGMQAAGHTTIGFCEIEAFPRAVLAANFPGVWIHDDIRTLSAELIRERCGRLPDIIVGGVPCQPASVAGKRKGAEDHRWLWGEFVRVVGECQPLWFVVENVPGFMSLSDAPAVFDQLEAQGYEILEPIILGARHVGAPHRRDRVWIIGRLADAARRARHKRAEWLRTGTAGESGIELANASLLSGERSRIPVRPGGPLETSSNTAGASDGMGHTIGIGRNAASDQISRSGGELLSELWEKATKLPGGSGRCRADSANGLADADREQFSQLASERSNSHEEQPTVAGSGDTGGIEGVADSQSGGQRTDRSTSGDARHLDECGAAGELADTNSQQSERRGRVGDVAGTPRETEVDRQQRERLWNSAVDCGSDGESELANTIRSISGPGSEPQQSLSDGRGIRSDFDWCGETRWPARRGERQHDWEAARLVQFSRKSQLGLGLPVDESAAELLAVAIRDNLVCCDAELRAIPQKLLEESSAFANRSGLKALGNSLIWIIPRMIGEWIAEQERPT